VLWPLQIQVFFYGLTCLHLFLRWVIFLTVSRKDLIRFCCWVCSILFVFARIVFACMNIEKPTFYLLYVNDSEWCIFSKKFEPIGLKNRLFLLCVYCIFCLLRGLRTMPRPMNGFEGNCVSFVSETESQRSECAF